MQDSATNPYIPEESKKIQRQTQAYHSPLKRIVKVAMIATGVIALLVVIALVVIIPRTSAEDKQARADLARALQPPGSLARQVPVTSTLGFSLSYDNQVLRSYAETVPVGNASPAYYENDDLRTVRDYNLVRLTPVVNTMSRNDATPNPPDLEVSSPVSAEQLKAAMEKPDYKGMSQLSAFVKISVDQRLANRTLDDDTIVSIEATKPTNYTVNDTAYQYVRFTTKNDNNRIANQKYDDCYYTIKNDATYAACIVNVRPANVNAAALVEKALQTLSYQKPAAESKNAPADDTAKKPAEQSNNTGKDTKQSEATSEPDAERQNELVFAPPFYYGDANSLQSVAKNQPSVVRVGTLYCADLQLRLIDGTTATTLTDACVGSLSSGTFVSQDGLIATAGHAIRFNPKAAINGYINFATDQNDLIDRLKRVLDYLMGAKIIQQSDADYLITGVRTNNQEALAKIDNLATMIDDTYITANKESYSYAVQMVDQPITVNASTGRPSFAFSDNVLEAKYVNDDFDSKKSLSWTFDSEKSPKDVGLLQLKGSYQNVPVTSGDTLKLNDQLTTIGLPIAVSSGLNIAKNQNEATVMTSKVTQSFDQNGHKLMAVDTPVLPGYDGAGAFNNRAEMAGVATYSVTYCPNKRCMAGGTIRSSDEVMDLINSKNMSLGEASQASVVWRKAVDDYFAANYSAARDGFAKAGSLNSFNQLATPLTKLSQSKIGSSSDTSLFNQLQGILIAVLIIALIATGALVGVYLIQKKRYDQLLVGHYGAESPSPQPVPSQVQQAPVQSQPIAQPAPQPLPYYGQPPSASSHAPAPQLTQPYAPQQQPQAMPQQSYAQPPQAPYQQPSPQQPQAQPQYPPQPQQPSQTPPQPPVANDPFYRQ